VNTLQKFANELSGKHLKRKTVEVILGVIFTIANYARKRKMPVPAVSCKDIALGKGMSRTAPHFTKEQAWRIIAKAEEPEKTLYSVAWLSGIRPGELLALTVDDLDLESQTLRIDETSDEVTRIRRAPKTEESKASLPIPSVLVNVLKDYLAKHWQANPQGLLFPNPDGTRPRSRDNVVKNKLKPLLRRLGIPDYGVGLHAFRHGYATALVQNGASLPTLRSLMRHADVATTLRVYAKAIPKDQREAVEKLSIGTVVPFGTVNAA
jgi:integrase